MKKNISYERYHRQIILKGFGEAAQQKLSEAKVLVAGAGGLGCPTLQYLAGAGIGKIGIVDDDVVMLSNLHRQVLFSVNDIGKSKAEIASHHLQQINTEIEIIPFSQRLTTENAIELISDFDYIVDGTDNFATRYMINDACVLLNKPLIFGAISQFEGQVAIFNYKKNEHDEAVNYRDLFPHPPKDGEILNCEEAGVLGILPGIIGTMMANETIKLVTGIGEPLINKLFTFNALTNQTYQLQLSATKESGLLIPKDAASFKEMNYEWLCSSVNEKLEIDANSFNNFIHDEHVDIIDVRELNEMPEANEFSNIKIPLAELEKNISLIRNETVVIFCQSGIRSLQAAKKLSVVFQNKKNVYSLKGGIISWIKSQSKQKA